MVYVRDWSCIFVGGDIGLRTASYFASYSVRSSVWRQVNVKIRIVGHVYREQNRDMLPQFHISLRLC